MIFVKFSNDARQQSFPVCLLNITGFMGVLQGLEFFILIGELSGKGKISFIFDHGAIILMNLYIYV